ncbi:hypothetical protein B0T45_16855 [Chromobacterium haemolyticum]|uniref:Uncharacterized protein n=1 Tax=Chromobacterium haemolyticum TaxID=394935 RepID=A0A1W0CM28_9NEIS|nr:hypothetical protein B0T45_16855 [Chromobacterium haemolyticum]
MGLRARRSYLLLAFIAFIKILLGIRLKKVIKKMMVLLIDYWSKGQFAMRMLLWLRTYAQWVPR